MFTIDPTTVRFIIERARIFDAGIESGDEDEDIAASGPHTAEEGLDDEGLEESPESDAVYGEIREIINDLNEDEQAELVALTWVGRGSFGSDEWDQALEEANRVHNNRTAEYLLGMPLLADYLAEGLSAFGETLEE